MLKEEKTTPSVSLHGNGMALTWAWRRDEMTFHPYVALTFRFVLKEENMIPERDLIMDEIEQVSKMQKTNAVQ
jgi:hypothetical protein